MGTTPRGASPGARSGDGMNEPTLRAPLAVSPATTPDNDTAFRKRLSALIGGYDAAHPADATHDDDGEQDQWDSAFEELLVEATDDQARRALKLLELHVQNRSHDAED